MFIMADNERNHSTPENVTYLREIRDLLRGIQEMIKEKHSSLEDDTPPWKINIHQHQNADDLWLSKDIVTDQLQICYSTLCKWRYKKLIKLRQISSRHVEYSFTDLMDALANNRLTARGFNPFAGYKHMLEWYEGNIGNLGKGK